MSRIFLILLGVTIAVNLGLASSTPPGFTKLKPWKSGSRVFNYYVSQGNATQLEANDSCAFLIFGRLATILDQSQLDHIVDEVAEVDAIGQHFWTAGQYTDGQWNWLTTGGIIDSLNWSSIGPCGGSPETFNGLFLVTDPSGPAYCNNQNSLQYRYICEV